MTLRGGVRMSWHIVCIDVRGDGHEPATWHADTMVINSSSVLRTVLYSYNSNHL